MSRLNKSPTYLYFLELLQF